MDPHPYLVHFPIALLFAAAGWYIFLFIRPDAGSAKAAILLHLLGVGTLLLAILSGNLAESNLVHTQAIHSLAEQHELLSYVTIWFFALLAVWYYLRFPRWARWEYLLYILAFWVGTGLMAYSASLGGRMVYQEGAGVKPMQQQLEQQFQQEQSKN